MDETLPKNLVAVYTFGSPRLFDTDLAIKYAQTVTDHRIVYENDIVPFLPFSLGFRHIENVPHKLKPVKNVENMQKDMFENMKKRNKLNQIGFMDLHNIENSIWTTMQGIYQGLKFAIQLFIFRNLIFKFILFVLKIDYSPKV